MASFIGIALWALIPGFIAKNKRRNALAYYLLSFIITPLLTMIITICLPKKTEFDCVKPTQIPFDESVDVFDESDDKICFCRKCGEKLLDRSNFCRKCGTEIVDLEKGSE